MADLLTVLFVDDEQKAQKYFRMAMRGICEVVCASGVDEALAILEQGATEIALLVTDQRMPKRNGLELLSIAYQDYPEMVRILTTAHMDVDSAIDAVNRGAIFRYVIKPWEVAQLQGYVRDALALYQANRSNKLLLNARRQSTLRVAANMAHELRTPLASIRAATLGMGKVYEELTRGYQLAVDQGLIDKPLTPRHRAALQHAFQRVRRDAEQAGAMVEMLLANAGIENRVDLDLDACSLTEMVEQTVSNYPFKSNEQGLVRVCSAKDVQCMGSPTLMTYVLYNLIRNALYAVAEKGEGEVVLSVDQQDAPTVVVRDTGVGIAEHVRPRIFDEFFTTKRSGSGNGIGLSFCKRAVERMGGEIEIDSKPGVFTEVRVQLSPASDHLPVHH